MREYRDIFKSFWQIGVPALLVLYVAEFIKPGFVQSKINLIALFVIIFCVWLLDTLVSEPDGED